RPPERYDVQQQGAQQQGAQQGSPVGGQHDAPPYGQQAPAGGQTWGGSWGPDQQPPAPQPEQSWPLPADQQQWGTQQPDAWGAGPLPPEAAQPPAPAPSYGHDALPPAQTPSYGQGGPQQPQQPQPPQPQQPQPQQPQQPYDSYGQQPQGYGSYGQGTPGMPLPPAVDEGATQYIPPVPADDARTQYIPPVPAADEGATQFLPPVGPGALPPETPAESTHFLGTGGGAQRNPGPMPGAGHPDAEATQYIPPVGAQAQPPAGFENLFRGGESPAGATQQLPRFSEPEPPGYGGGGPQGYGARPDARAPQPAYVPPARDDDHDGGRGGGSRSRVPLFAGIGVVLAAVGIGAGALLGGGGGDDQGANKTVAASAPATGESASSDAAKDQAVALDKLLADSGSSRASVISAVASVKTCDNLPQAAADLRDAAGQRTGLVTKLSGLSVDQLPDHAALTSALTKAWQASAAADNHYAAWADQVAGNKRKNCRKGAARTTAETQAGNRESGTASARKAEAAKLWNAIAKTYGLTQRQPTQL
ncbi:hypothetical protein ACWD25_53275, partial [Streptomyces sp. NPDC002920]